MSSLHKTIVELRRVLQEAENASILEEELKKIEMKYEDFVMAARRLRRQRVLSESGVLSPEFWEAVGGVIDLIPREWL